MFTSILVNSLWAAVSATSLGVILTSPPRTLLLCCAGGFTGRCIRDLFMAGGLSQNWSTVIASAVVVLVAVILAKRRRLSPVVLICSVLPMGATVALINCLFELMRMSSLQGEVLNASVVGFGANLSKALTGTLAIALGLATGMGLSRAFRSAE